jgi:YegS/Rv2252/BmrU family lipid kinase
MKPEDGHIVCIVNPKSGTGSTKYLGRSFQNYLVSKGYDLRIFPTTSLEHACELATDAAVDFDCKVVVAVGGDGTVREVAHGLEGSDKPLLIVPAGTENLLANELGFSEKLSFLIEIFEQAYTRPLDLGCVNGKCFTSIAGFGFDGRIVHRMHKQRKGHIDHFDYFWPIWRTFWDYKFKPIKVEIDGEFVFDGPGLVFVGNLSRYAAGLYILRHADISDGLLDVCIYKCSHKPHLVKHSIMTLLKRHVYGKDVIYQQGKTVTVSSDSNQIEAEIDGDPGPSLPVKIEIIPNAVNVMVKKDAKPAGITTRILRALK